jgi:cell division GTPase FtsZ
VNILLLSAGGGGGNILRSLKALFYRDLSVVEKTDPAYAKRLRDAVTTRFLDTNNFSLADIPSEERLLIGPQTTGRIGARHNPDVARQALEESRTEVDDLIQRHSVVVVIGTGGKGTGAGTIFPLAQMARRHRKLVLPIFVRPSFERHEVDKRRYDHALQVAAQFDAAGIRLMEILNDRGYIEDDPRSQTVVWERMNAPIARSLRGLIYVLWELSQVDPSDLSILFAGNGRFRMAFAEIDPPAGQDPAHAQVEEAVKRCCENTFFAFGRPAGTSLVCIQGEWSNVVDAKIKSQVAASANGSRAKSTYTPLYARAVDVPRPWGVTALFAEHTGVHLPLEIDWSFAGEPLVHADRRQVDEPIVIVRLEDPVPVAVAQPAEPVLAAIAQPAEPVLAAADTQEPAPIESAPSPPSIPCPFSSLWELAIAVNRSDPAALAVAAASAVPEIPIEGAEVKKLASTLWFRAVVPRFSEGWKARILAVLVDSVAIPNHRIGRGRDRRTISEMDYAGLQAVSRTSIPETIRADLELLLTVGRLFGADSVKRFRFEPVESHDRSRLASLLHAWRNPERAAM